MLDIQPDGKPIHESSTSPLSNGNWRDIDIECLSFLQKWFSSIRGDSSNKFHVNDSDSSRSAENSSQEDSEDDLNEPSTTTNIQESVGPTYKCSLCDFHSINSWNVQKHINDKHAEQHTAFVLTQWRTAKPSLDESNNQKQKNGKQKTNNSQTRSLSPASAIAKAKFPPIVEEALLSLQGSKLNRHLYSAQPKFGIKRLKCRHCFYRSNWKTDMIRHVRIRHNINEPDHHRGSLSTTTSSKLHFVSRFRHDCYDRTRGPINDRVLREHVRQRTSSTNIPNMERLVQSGTRIHAQRRFIEIRNCESLFFWDLMLSDDGSFIRYSIV